jgi:hypothetical protein
MFQIGDMVYMQTDKNEAIVFGIIEDTLWPTNNKNYLQETLYMVKWFDDKITEEVACDLKRV